MFVPCFFYFFIKENLLTALQLLLQTTKMPSDRTENLEHFPHPLKDLCLDGQAVPHKLSHKQAHSSF